MSSVPDPRVSVQPAITRHGTARLFIAIGSSLYALIPHHGTVPAWDLVVRQGREPGARYTALVNAHGHPACTCPDHQNRGTRCKHLGALLAAGLLSAPPAAPAPLPAPVPAAPARSRARRAKAVMS